MILLLLCSASLHVKKLSLIFLYYYNVHGISCAKGNIIALISLLLETAIFKNDMLDVFSTIIHELVDNLWNKRGEQKIIHHYIFYK